MRKTFDTYQPYGFGSECYSRVLRPGRAAQDTALVTEPNNGVPGELPTFFDPEVIKILTAIRAARELTGGKEVLKGNAATTTAKFPVVEYAGHTEPYDDFADGGAVTINANWVARDNYLFQTTQVTGDLAQRRTATAKINLSAEMQQAAAEIIDVDANRFYFYGVAGLRNYGILNDPGLNATITPAAVGTGDSPLWANKTQQQIYNDVLALFQQLVTQMGGRVKATDPLILAMSPSINVMLGKINDLGQSVLKSLNDYFPSLTIVVAPEYDTTGGELMQMIAPRVMGKETIMLCPSEKMYSFAPLKIHSRVEQKFRAGTFGAVIARPAAIAGMLGM